MTMVLHGMTMEEKGMSKIKVNLLNNAAHDKPKMQALVLTQNGMGVHLANAALLAP